MTTDLISFIPGIGATAAFTPGPSTPSPFNVPFIGGTDGTGPSTATNNMAEIYNRLLLAHYSVIATAGLTYNKDNWTQLAQAVQALATAGGPFVSVSQYNTDFTHSLATNGYQEFPGGRIEQECDVFVSSIADGEVTVTYPIAFPTAGKLPLVSLQDTGRAGDESNFLGMSVISFSTTGCVVALGQNGGGARTVTLHVEVVGH